MGHKVHLIAPCGTNKSIFWLTSKKNRVTVCFEARKCLISQLLLFSTLLVKIAIFLSQKRRWQFYFYCLFWDGKMANFTTVAIFPTRGENSHFPVSKQTVKVQLSLDMLGKITCFTRGKQAIIISFDCSIRLRLVLQTLHSLAMAYFPH